MELLMDHDAHVTRPEHCEPRATPFWIEFSEGGGRITGLTWRSMWFGDTSAERG
jgi:hypothetical protein